MSRKKKRPLPRRALRLDRPGRLQAGRSWLALQRGRPAQRIARSYRKHFGVDWECAIAELNLLGIPFPVRWLEQIALTLKDAPLARARRLAEQKQARCGAGAIESEETFAFIAGYTEGGAPYGVTWEEGNANQESSESASSEPAAEVASPDFDEKEQLSF